MELVYNRGLKPEDTKRPYVLVVDALRAKSEVSKVAIFGSLNLVLGLHVLIYTYKIGAKTLAG